MGGFFMEKMMIPDNYKPIRQVGNGKTVSFSFDFPMLSENFVKVYREQGGVQELVDPSEYVWGYIPVEGEDAPVEDIAPENVITFYEAPADGVVIVIAREIPLEQTTPYKTSSGFPAVRVEDNFDKLTAITQQLMEEVDRCVKVEITGDQTPEELLAEVYGKLDSATEVAQDAIEAANQAQTAADNATSAVEEAKQQVADTKVYVDSAKADIDNTVALAKSDIESTKDSTIAVVTSTSASAVATIEQTVVGGKQEINTTIEEAQTSLSNTIAQAVEDVKAEATKAAEDAIQNAADEATQVATKQTIEYIENTAIPAISAVKDSAVSELESVLANDKSTLEGYVQVASDSVAISTQRASEAAESARVASEKVNQIDGVVGEVNAAAASASASAVRSENSAVRAEEAEQRIMESGALPSQAGNEGKFLTTDGAEASWADVGGGLEIGDIGFAPLGIDETQNKRRYLNGQVISQSQFESFTNKVKAAIQLTPSLATSETNWQAEVTNSKLGQCGKFVIDDTLGTIRLPKVVNINGLQDLSLLGGIKAESLPNITGSFTSGDNTDLNVSGAFYVASPTSTEKLGSGSYERCVDGFDASLSSSTYQDNAPVQQEAIQYPYFIQVATGTEESVDVTREIELNNPFSLLDYKWSEYELSNASWLLSNGAFHSGTTYVAVYNLLLEIYNGTVTKDGVSVKLSTEAYEDTDFVLNTADTTFRLPIKVANAPMGGVAPVKLIKNGTVTTAQTGTNADYGLTSAIYTNAPNASKATIEWETDLSQATNDKLKLYFYVGETIQDANVIVASNVLTTIANADYVVESYNDGTNWYRVYKSGWIEQGGTMKGEATLNFLRPFKDVNYTMVAFVIMMNASSGSNDVCYRDKTATSIFVQPRFGGGGQTEKDVMWYACGQGE